MGTRRMITAGSKWFSCALEACKVGSENDARFDGVVLVSDSLNNANNFGDVLIQQSTIDAAFEKEGGVVSAPLIKSGRIVYSPIGPLNKDYSDVRLYAEAAEKGIKRALAAGMKRPYLYMTPAANNPNYQHGNLVSILGALHALYVPLEVRESVPQKAFKAEMLGLDCPSNESLQKLAFALESGRIAGRDIGGADIKAGGVMAGMHRDKCGSAAVAAFMKVVAELQPKNIEVVGAMCMVRNSVGSNAYVSDEIITSRAGVRIRIGNTDAEGRMAMSDVLCKLKEEAVNAVNPQLMTVATLTGHACLAVGEPYSIVMDNGPAAKMNVARELQSSGHVMGDFFEVSTIRKEDYDFHRGKSEYEDVLQANNLPSSRTPRGHQAPAAFIILASGLDKHGIDGNVALPFSHLDIAAGSGPFPGVPSSSPVLALSRYFMPQYFQ